MAKVTLSGLDDIVKVIQKLGDKTYEITDNALVAGGVTAKEVLKDAAESHRGSGNMYNSIGFKDPQGKGSQRYVKVYPRGKDGNGVPNALKGFVINYGRKTYRPFGGDHWFTGAASQAELEAENAMLDVLEKSYDEIMKGN